MGELLDFLTAHEAQFRRARLGALYSDFRHLRTTNPDGYAANVEAWQNGLVNAAKAGCMPNRGGFGDTLILRIDDDLLSALETKEWGRPLALGAVVREAISKKELIPMQEFSSAKESIYRRTPGISPWAVLSWGLKQIGLFGGESADDLVPQGKLVMMKNLEEVSRLFAAQSVKQSSRTDRIMSRKLFEQTYGSLLGDKHPLSEADMTVLLQFLERDQGLAAFDGKTVKLKGSSEDRVTITQEDSTIASLKSLISDMEVQLDFLTRRIDTLTIAAREAVAKNNRISALASLRSKKIAETNLSRQSATLGQLEEVYSKIGQAADQVDLVRIMEGSTGVLKKLNAEIGGVERVDDIVDELKEQMMKVDEVNNTITEVGQSGTIDEDEIDGELEAMEAAERTKVGQEEKERKTETERQEVEETRKKLDVLESIERRARVKEAEGKLTEDTSSKRAVEESIQAVGRLSL